MGRSLHTLHASAMAVSLPISDTDSDTSYVKLSNGKEVSCNSQNSALSTQDDVNAFGKLRCEKAKTLEICGSRRNYCDVESCNVRSLANLRTIETIGDFAMCHTEAESLQGVGGVSEIGDGHVQASPDT